METVYLKVSDLIEYLENNCPGWATPLKADIKNISPADVIERSEYEKLRLVNLDLARTNKGLLAEHGQLEKLRSKIDNVIEEIRTIRDNYEKINNPWGDRWDYTNPYDEVLKILKEI